MFVSSLETKIGLKSLPDEMRDLSSLQILEIRRCPELQRTCEKETGQDWDKITHITEGTHSIYLYLFIYLFFVLNFCLLAEKTVENERK